MALNELHNFTRIYRRTRYIIWFENIIRAIFPVAIGTASYLTALIIISTTTNWLSHDHLANLFSLIFYISVILSLFIRLRRITPTSHHDILNRIEHDNDLPHYPLHALYDKLAEQNNNKSKSSYSVTELIWNRFQGENVQITSQLSTKLPKIGLTKIDPLAIRYLVILCLCCAYIIIGQGQIKSSLKTILSPNLSASLFPQNQDITLTITYPSYTGLTPRKYTNRTNNINNLNKDEYIIDIIENSQINISTNSFIGTPRLSIGNYIIPIPNRQDLIDDKGLKQSLSSPHAFWQAHEHHLTITLDRNTFPELFSTAKKSKTQKEGTVGTVSNQTKITLTQFGLTRATWMGNFTRDIAPTLSQNGDTKSTKLAATQIPVSVTDDFGTQSIEMHLLPQNNIPLPQIIPPKPYLQAIGRGPGTYDITPIFDLTDHPWAGLPVIITLNAHDTADQASPTLAIKTILPERKFSHPVAARLIEYRQEIAWTPYISAPDIADKLTELLLFPQEIDNDTTLFASIEYAIDFLSRLDASRPDPDQISQIFDLLWALAIQIEDGNLSLALRRLNQAQQDLLAALPDYQANKIPDLTKEIDDLSQGLSRFLNELHKDIQKQQAGLPPNATPRITSDIIDKSLTPDIIDQFIRQLNSAITARNWDMAYMLLGQLRALIDTLDPNSTKPPPQKAQNIKRGINEIQELIDHLRQLKFDTQKLSQKRADERAKQRRNHQILPDNNSTIRPHIFQSPQALPELAPGVNLNDLYFEFYKRHLNRDTPIFPPNTIPDLSQKDIDKLTEPGTAQISPTIPITPITPTEDPDQILPPPINYDLNMPPTNNNLAQEFITKDQEQWAMRQILGQIIKEIGTAIGDIPRPMGESELFMRQSQSFLRHENAPQSIIEQQAAIDKLLDGQKELADQLQKEFGDQSPRDPGLQNQDPLGRPSPYSQDDGDGQSNQFGEFGQPSPFSPSIDIPENNQQKYIDDIIKTLRDKSGELTRPEQERNYINRLLDDN